MSNPTKHNKHNSPKQKMQLEKPIDTKHQKEDKQIEQWTNPSKHKQREASQPPNNKPLSHNEQKRPHLLLLTNQR